MDKIPELLKLLGYSDSFVANSTITVIIISVLSGLSIGCWKLIKFIDSLRKNRTKNKNLTPYYEQSQIKKAVEFYIPTKYQKNNPFSDESKLYNNLEKPKNLIRFFLKKVFKDKTEAKFYLILADTGMGKTTFLVNLYLHYKNRWSNLFGFSSWDIDLHYLGEKKALERFSQIDSEKKKHKILLLDSFDEDVNAIESPMDRLEKIAEEANEYRKVVITCRTQFFLSEEDEPNETKVPSGGQIGHHKYEKLYVSPFSDADVEKYLKKRYSIFNHSERKKAFSLVEKNPEITFRPLLLDFIGELIGEDEIFEYSHQLYEKLIDKWINREADKFIIGEKYKDREKYKKLFREFSRQVAISIYDKSKIMKRGYFITRNEVLPSELQLSDFEQDYLSEADLSKNVKELKSRSLLVRGSKDRFFFAHKSILEYYLARECFQNGKFLSTFDFKLMSFAKKCLSEMLMEKIPKLIGEFSIDGNIKKPLFQLNVDNFSKITELKVTKFGDFSPLNLSVFSNLEELIINDREKYSALYDLYVLSSFDWEELLVNLQLLQLELQERKDLTERLKLLRQRELLEQLERRKLPEKLERQELLEQLERLEMLFKMGDNDLLKILRPIENYLFEMKLLQEKLPNCKMWY